MVKIIENTTKLEINPWKDRRVYINAKLNVLAHDLYFDLNTEQVHFKSNNQSVGKRAGWKVEKTEKGFKIFSSVLLDHYFVIER